MVSLTVVLMVVMSDVVKVDMKDDLKVMKLVVWLVSQ